MLEYAWDDGGREAAGYAAPVDGDCVPRALSIVTGCGYLTAYWACAGANADAGDAIASCAGGVRQDAAEAVYRAYGLVRVALGRGARPTFGEAYRRYGDCIVTTAVRGRPHDAAIVAGVLRDVVDLRRTRGGGERKALAVWGFCFGS